jgi:serine protease Do
MTCAPGWAHCEIPLESSSWARAADLILPDTGLEAGDIIHQLNSTPVDSVDSLRTLVAGLKKGDPVVLQVERDGGLLFVSFEME